MSLWSEEKNGEWHEMKIRQGEEKGKMEKRDEDEEQGHMGRGGEEMKPAYWLNK
jgi:hypothetical protein